MFGNLLSRDRQKDSTTVDREEANDLMHFTYALAKIRVQHFQKNAL